MRYRKRRFRSKKYTFWQLQALDFDRKRFFAFFVCVCVCGGGGGGGVIESDLLIINLHLPPTRFIRFMKHIPIPKAFVWDLFRRSVKYVYYGKRPEVL